MCERGLTRRSLLTATGAGGLALTRAAHARAAVATALDPPDLRAQQIRRTVADAAALATIAPTLPAGPGQPSIVAREAWAQGRCQPRVAPEYGSVQMAVVHHTENPNGYTPEQVPAMLRAIYVFHRYGRGWNDIGYNFVIDRFGRIFEGRAGGIDEAVIGAQAGGYNYVSTGIAILGEYGAVRISAAARTALCQLLAWKLSLHGTPVSGEVAVRVDPAGAVYSRYPAGAHVRLPRVAGHRDADTTECPGNALYGELPGVRQSAAALAGAPARLTLGVRSAAAGAPNVAGEAGAPSTAPTPGPPGAPGTAGATGAPTVLAGALKLLGAAETPIAGAPIAIQLRSVARHGELVGESTLATTVSAADGSFSVPLAAAPGAPPAAVRALCPGGAGVPAAVSAAVALRSVIVPTAPAAPPAAP
jgi:hypothetical protein